MGIIEIVPKNSVIPTAIKLIKKSKTSLHLTMIMEDELNFPNPQYINILNNKIKQGIEIKRIGFGTISQFAEAQEQFNYYELPKNFTFVRNSDTNIAQRLLISDEKEMIFAVYIDKKNKLVFYTKSKEIVYGFVSYFNNIFDKIK